MWGVRRNGKKIYPGNGGFLGNRVIYKNAVFQFVRSCAGQSSVTIIGNNRTQFAGSQFLDDGATVKMPYIGSDAHEQFLSLFQIRFLDGVGIETEIVQSNRNNLGPGIEKGHSAIAQLRDIFRFKKKIPASQICVGQSFFHHGIVKGDTCGSPHVRHAIIVALIIRGETG